MIMHVNWVNCIYFEEYLTVINILNIKSCKNLETKERKNYSRVIIIVPRHKHTQNKLKLKAYEIVEKYMYINSL